MRALDRREHVVSPLDSNPTRHARSVRSVRSVHLVAAIVMVGSVLIPNQASAQQAQLDLHGNFAVGTSTHNKSWGGGVGAQVTVGSRPVKVSLAPSLDYLKQQNDGPSQTTLSADLDVQPGGNSPVTPYAGVSAGANWSGGSNKQWEGAKPGFETLAGLQIKLGKSSVSAKAEERFGYVQDQEHSLTTRVGALISF
jgi:hypothetical protein